MASRSVCVALRHVTLLAGLAGETRPHLVRRALSAQLLVPGRARPAGWIPAGPHPYQHAGQALAWLIGSALTIAYAAMVWLVAGRTAQPEPIAEIPGSTAPVKRTRPLILFAAIRAVAVAITVAIAFGLHGHNADWMPIAALVAMKPSLAESILVAVRRPPGAIIGAAVAAALFLTVAAGPA